jgi:hypothetical protein
MNVSIVSERWIAALVCIGALSAGCGSDDSKDASMPSPNGPVDGTPASSATDMPPAVSATAPTDSAAATPGAAPSSEMVAVEAIDPAQVEPPAATDTSATPAEQDPGTIAAGGASKCAAGTAGLCDGFEAAAPGQMGSAFSFEVGNGSTATVDATKAYRGANAVHIKTNGGGAFITETESFTGTTAATNNEMWGRIFIWFETNANPQSHDVFITLADPDSNAASSELHLAGGSRGILAAQIRTNTDVYRPAIMAAQGMPTSVKFPLAEPRWQCWEWHTTAENTLEFYIDGELYSPMSVQAADKWPFPVFKKLSLGFMQYGNTPATELWIDEVAVGGARIGCGG